MVHYEPHDIVLQGYDDESLHAETLFVGEAAKQLLRLPPEYRQTCEVEVKRRGFQWEQDICKVAHNLDEVRAEVVAEILAQLEGE